MKTNRPTNQRSRKAETWYDLGYEDAVLDHDFTNTAYAKDWDKGWMEARDDMEEVMEIVHFCLQKDKTYLAKIVMEAHLKLESSDG
jgi:hypothetical protein